MKTYSEPWFNPKTKKEEQIEVEEYSFEDWESGRMIGEWKSGKRLIFNGDTQKHFYTFLPHIEYEKMQESRKDIYWKKVEQQFKEHKIVFHITLEKSENRERLFQIEIKKAEDILFKSDLYEQLIVRGKREYQHTNSPNSKISLGIADYHHIRIEALSRFYEWLKDKADSNTSKEIKFYNDDPKKGGKQVSHYEYMEASGLIDGLSESGMVINPVHDFELLKAKRNELFIKEQKKFIAGRTLNKLKTTNFELNSHYVMWLNNELEVIKRWLSDKYPNGKHKGRESNSNQIEIMKYNHYVNNEIKATELKITPPQKEPITISNGKKYYSDSDFVSIINEMLNLEMFQITDFLEYHFSQAFVANSMSKFNWLTSLRKNLMSKFTAPEKITNMGYTVDPSSKTPSQINLAYKWERDKTMQLVKETEERTNPRINKNGASKIEPPSEIKSTPSPQLKTIEELKTLENQFWKGIPIEKVIDHFKIMTETESKNGTPFLTNEQLISFVQRAFIKDKKQPKQKINFANGEKGFVIKRFYEFFDMAVTRYAEVNKKDKYIKLVHNNFDNLGTFQTIESFFKSSKTKRKW